MNRPVTVVCSRAWPLNSGEAAGDLVLIKNQVVLRLRN